ncbi:hypothetical protein P9990_25210 (plasmid) [Prescottella equi]|uniref:hypothetical protein n=1 Tax=Rhodococcus hoagii TaxID=43767 RepID=UPI002575BDC0|nr:hypothetical protein [Prescottella equi]WJJ14495.1 hypothetical protein P9990_25210 [Prescottella equi]
MSSNAEAAYRIGVVGPSDLVSLVKRVAALEFTDHVVVPLTYRNEEQALDVIAAHPDIDALLFTGVIPYTLAQAAGILTKPAAYIDYTGATLYGALVELMSAGHDPAIASIDTLARPLVVESLTHVGIATDRVATMEYRNGIDAARLAAFHREHARQHPGSVAITCVRSVYELIREDMDAIRLAPAIASVRTALDSLTMELAGRISSDAQVVLGMIELPESDDRLADDARALASSVFPTGPADYVLVSTRGVLAQHTCDWTVMPLLEQLAERHTWVRIGLGVGRSAADAEALARRAVDRCRTAGPFAAVVSVGIGRDFVITDTDSGRSEEPLDLHVAARRAGLSRATLIKLEAAVAAHPDGEVTAADVATALGIEPRSARRTLKQLERAGLARPVGTVGTGAGRPAVRYALQLAGLAGKGSLDAQERWATTPAGDLHYGYGS